MSKKSSMERWTLCKTLNRQSELIQEPTWTPGWRNQCTGSEAVRHHGRFCSCSRCVSKMIPILYLYVFFFSVPYIVPTRINSLIWKGICWQRVLGHHYNWLCIVYRRQGDTHWASPTRYTNIVSDAPTHQQGFFSNKTHIFQIISIDPRAYKVNTD